MHIQHIKSATAVVESNGFKILMDPWLVDGEYYGSWSHYPPLEVDWEYFNSVDYIYISHIHPDHFSRKTLEHIDKSIPVLIHQFSADFLRKNLERLGFQVRELPHNQRTELGKGVHINILSADNCNPALCAKFMGCSIVEVKYQYTQIDSLCVIDDGTDAIVNLNDCPIALAREVLQVVKEQYCQIKLLLVGYAGAGPYPQCFSLGEEERQQAEQKKKLQFLQQAEDYISLLKPKFYLPFAGTYTLSGSLSKLQHHRGVPELEEALDYLQTSDKVKNSGAEGLLLNSYESFDIKTEATSKEYEPIDPVAKQQYIQNVLAKKPYDFEADPDVEEAALEALLPAAYERMNRKREQLNFSSDTKVLVKLVDAYACVSMQAKGWEVIKKPDLDKLTPFVILEVNPKLLLRILKGPRYAHWNNAEIGSHIKYTRVPNTFERALYHCMCYFHA